MHRPAPIARTVPTPDQAGTADVGAGNGPAPSAGPVRVFGRRPRRLGHRGVTAGVLLVTVAALCALPAGPAPGSIGSRPVRAAATCTGWTSDTVPPTTIRVLRTSGPAAGSVQAVPFQQYVDIVMAAEWGADDPPEVLKAGAVAAKQYAWYHAMVWRGGTASDGSCYDVVDSSSDQVYSPETETPSPSEVSAVDATWSESLHKDGSLFVTHYDAGSNVACGANANGWYLYQVSATRCAQEGMPADTILQTYYGPGVEILGSTATSTPTPTPTPTPGSTAAALRFSASPQDGTAAAPLTPPPAVAVVDGSGQTVTAGPGSTTDVTLALAGGAPGAVLSCAGGLSRPAVAGVATFEGCSVSPAGQGYVLVASAAGLPPVGSSPFAIAAMAPSLSIGVAPRVITWAGTARLTATLAPPPGGPGVAGRTIDLQRSTDGRTWISTARLVTDSSGTVHLDLRPAANEYVRAVFEGAADLGPAQSPAERVLVRQLMLLRPDTPGPARIVGRGTMVTFTALVRPARSDLPPGRVLYRVYRLVGRSWILQRQTDVTADAAGRADLPVTFSAGRWYVRAVALPTVANANSAWSPLELYLVR